MQEQIRGKVYVLGDDIDTDQIIPAQHLVYSLTDPEERRLYGRYALSGVPPAQGGLPKGDIPFINPGAERSDFSIIVAGRNFGCGSSREHAPFALAEAGVAAVVAESYARIFFRNCVNGGYVAPCETERRLVERFETGQEAELAVSKAILKNLATGAEFPLRPLGEVKPIIEAGGIFAYARKEGILK